MFTEFYLLISELSGLNRHAWAFLTFTFNLFVWLFSSRIINWLSPRRDEEISARRLRNLRRLNLLVFLATLVTVTLTLLFSVEPTEDGEQAGLISSMVDTLEQLNKSMLVFVCGYLVHYAAKAYAVLRFGKSKQIDKGHTVLAETYQSEMAGLLVLLVVLVTSFLSLLNIWEMNDLLEATSVLGGLLIIAYSSKDIWAPENVNGLILLYNDNVGPGTVVRVPELNLLAVVQQVTLTQTSFRDLRQKHLILIPNSRFRSAKIEVLSDATTKGLVDFVDFNIGYGVTGEQVEPFLEKVWEKACQLESSINEKSKPRVALVNNGDHAVTWRLFYTVKNCYVILGAGFAINRAAYDLSLAAGISLSTPLIHEIHAFPTQPTPLVSGEEPKLNKQ